jgi:glycerate kinase
VSDGLVDRLTVQIQYQQNNFGHSLPHSLPHSLLQSLPRSLLLEKQDHYIMAPPQSANMFALFRRVSFQKRSHAPRILVCPSGFKESLDPNTAADCITTGIRRIMPHASVVKAPLVDGGEGFAKALVASTGGSLHHAQVIGPVGDVIESHLGFLGGDQSKTAVVEMAAAAGLSLVPRDRRNPLYTTTYGVGQLISAALDAGAEHILLGCGDSGTCDGGVGMAQALGARFYNSDGGIVPLASGGKALVELSRVDLTGLHPRLSVVKIDAAVNWHNVLCGDKGVARVFGPQKGASSREVEELAHSMERIASVAKAALGEDISLAPGIGASGGLGAGLRLVGACLHPRYDIIMQFLDIDSLISDCDLIITAEGGIDYQTPRGKIPSEVARRARAYNVPVVALAGTIGEGAGVNYDAGIHAYASIVQRPMTLEVAIEEAEQMLADAAESAIRMVLIGWTIGRASLPPRMDETPGVIYASKVQKIARSLC